MSYMIRGIAAEEAVIEKLVAGMTERFGELKLQEGKYHPIGHQYEQTWDDQGCTTITDGQEFYTKTIEPVAIPSGVKSRLLKEKEKSEKEDDRQMEKESEDENDEVQR